MVRIREYGTVGSRKIGEGAKSDPNGKDTKTRPNLTSISSAIRVTDVIFRRV
jgi:hypothetical protein